MPAGKYPRLSATDRFLRNVRRDNATECWKWTAFKNRHGYGRMTFGGTLWLAHRISWKLFRGEIPERMHVLHKCDNPGCVNPDHLWLGTQADNMRDMAGKGRAAGGETHSERMRECAARGEAHAYAKLTAAEVMEIFASHLRAAEIAAKFQVSRHTVNRIKARKTWRSVLGDASRDRVAKLAGG